MRGKLSEMYGRLFVGSWLTLVFAATSCGSEPPIPIPIPISEVTAGVTLRGAAYVSREDHLVELVVHEGHIYAANSNRAVGALRLEADGGVTLTDEGTLETAGIRCTSLAVHAPSDTLYCGSDAPGNDETPHLVRYDISTPGTLSLVGEFELVGWGVRDLEVVGDHLLLNQFDAGLWSAAIDERGELTALSDTGVQGNARVSVALGDRIVTLFADVEGQGAELRLLDPGDWPGPGELLDPSGAALDDGWSELDRIGLSGPALGLSADAEGAPVVAVGLGSGGMAIVDVVDDRLVLRRILEPPAVVTQGLIQGDIAAAVTLSGVFTWTLADGEEPALFGFGPAAQAGHERAGNMLHGVVHAGELLTSDWLHVERWGLDPAGEVVDLDVPRGVYVGPEGPIRWRVRNPGQIPLRAEFWLAGRPILQAMVEPGEVVELELPVELRARHFAVEDPAMHVSVRVYDPVVPSEGTPLSSTVLAFAQREAQAVLPPATGDQFPPIALAELDLEQVYSFPTPSGSQTIWFWPDCGLMWPQLEDLAWLTREGRDLGRGEPVFLAEFDLESDGFPTRWGLDGARFGLWGWHAPPEVTEANASYGEDIYSPFFIQEMPGDAMPTDYVVDGAGTIVSIERMYRGPWTLAVPWPWD